MALDKMAQELVAETIQAVNGAQGEFQKPVRISPRRMRAMILFSQQNIRWQRPDGQVVVLTDDDTAPELAEAVREAMEAPEPEHIEPTPEELEELRALRAARKAEKQGVEAYKEAKGT